MQQLAASAAAEVYEKIGRRFECAALNARIALVFLNCWSLSLHHFISSLLLAVYSRFFSAGSQVYSSHLSYIYARQLLAHRLTAFYIFRLFIHCVTLYIYHFFTIILKSKFNGGNAPLLYNRSSEHAHLEFILAY